MAASQVTMHLRPFETLLVAENNALKCSGRIDGKTFVLNFGEGVHGLPLLEIGSDQWGPYAVVEESETPLGSGFVLTVERNIEEPDFEAGVTFQPGCRIALARPAQIDVAQLGIDPKTVNVVVPLDASVAIYFNAAGTVDGYSMQASSDAEPMRPQ